MNERLIQAKKNKKDEFYTRYSDIEKELKHYKIHLKDKVIYCNCDDSRKSNFVKYFIDNFKELGLKKLISSHVADSFYVEFDGNQTHKIELSGNGDFRSSECTELLIKADIVITNPPFSLFREYVAQLMHHSKKFIIIGHQSAISYKEFFKNVKCNEIWLGWEKLHNFINEIYDDYSKVKNIDGFLRVSGVVWFTNLKINKHLTNISMSKTYNEIDYPKYHNYDAINVNKTKDIPVDYFGIMGVPITFLHKHNPAQFEIVGLTSGRYEFEAQPIIKYLNPKQIDGVKISNGSKVNTGATILYRNKPEGIYYVADNADGYLKRLFARILIKRVR